MTRVLTLLELQGLAASLYALSRVDECVQFHQYRAYYQERAAHYAAYVRQRLDVNNDQYTIEQPQPENQQ